MLARLDHRRHVLRPEVGRRRLQDDVDVRVDELLVGVEAGVAARLSYILAAFLQEPPRFGDAVGEDVSQGDDLQVGASVEKVRGRAAAAPAAADEAGLQNRAVRAPVRP